MIGNEKDALLIHNWWHSHRDSYRKPPKGWKYLGDGSFRTAYLSPDGVVYKIQKDLSGVRYLTNQTNYGEYETWKRLYFGCKMPKHSRLPKLSYYAVPGQHNVGVIAIERLRKNPPYYEQVNKTGEEYLYWSDVASAVASACQVGDLYGDNIFLDEENNLLVPTDLGVGR